MGEVYCGQVSFFYVQYFLRYELFSPILVKYFGQVQTDYRRQTESDAYEPTVQLAQVGLKNCVRERSWNALNFRPNARFNINNKCHVSNSETLKVLIP